MKKHLMRIKVDGNAVLYIDAQGEAHWLDLEKFRSFCERYLGTSVLTSMGRGPVTEVVETVAIDMDLVSVGIPPSSSRASVRLAFGVEDRNEG